MGAPSTRAVRRAHAPRTRTIATSGLVTLAVAGLLGCSAGGTPAPSPSASGSSPAPSTSSPESEPSGSRPAAPRRVEVEGVVTRDLTSPWGVARTQDGSALVAERDTARVLQVRPGAEPVVLGTVPGVQHGGEGGLLGLALSPDEKWLYAYFTSVDEDNRVVRMRLTSSGLGPVDVLLDGIPSGGIHNGGRLALGPDGRLWVATGDAGRRELAQDPGSLGGKILRLELDGSVPQDNPDPGSPVWSLGHRNVQGLAFDSRGRLWATEFGQDRWDELNLVLAGANYGWPVVEGQAGNDRFVDPLATWRPDESSPSGLAIVDDVAYVAALRGARLWQVVLTGPDAGRTRAHVVGDYGRLRTVLAVGNQTMWLTTSNTDGRGYPGPTDDRLLRVRLR